ncbi:hypothetical protein BOW32_11780, partial [Solemya velum gill symbiont]
KSTKLALNMIQSYDTDEETRTSQIIITETPEINFTSTNPFNVLPLGEYSDISDDGQCEPMDSPETPPPKPPPRTSIPPKEDTAKKKNKSPQKASKNGAPKK